MSTDRLKISMLLSALIFNGVASQVEDGGAAAGRRLGSLFQTSNAAFCKTSCLSDYGNVFCSNKDHSEGICCTDAESCRGDENSFRFCSNHFSKPQYPRTYEYSFSSNNPPKTDFMYGDTFTSTRAPLEPASISGDPDVLSFSSTGPPLDSLKETTFSSKGLPNRRTLAAAAPSSSKQEFSPYDGLSLFACPFETKKCGSS